MKRPRKLIYGLGTLSTLAFPLATAVSCGDDEKTKKMDGTITIANNNFQARAKVSQAIANGTVTNRNGWKTVLTLDGHDHSKDDKSFNENSYAGMVAANSIIPKRTIDHVKPESSEESGFVGMYSALAVKSLIIAPGFLHISKLNSKKGVDAIKNKAVILLDGDVKAKNIASVVFKSHQAGFLAGYMAGHYLNLKANEFEAGGLKVATFGGMNIPGVTPFMAGFQNGIKYFNANKEATQKEITFIDNGGLADYFTNSFAAGNGKAMAEKLLEMGADLIFPVAGPQVKDVETAIKKKQSSAKIIGVDVAQELNSAFSKVVFSAIKDLKTAVKKMIEVVSGTKTKEDDGYAGFEGFGGLTIGTIDNGLVGVSKGKASDTTAATAYTKITKTIQAAAKSETHNPLAFKY